MFTLLGDKRPLKRRQIETEVYILLEGQLIKCSNFIPKILSVTCSKWLLCYYFVCMFVYKAGFLYFYYLVELRNKSS